MSKSPASVARAALATAGRSMPRYAHRYSPKLYTQPHLFACLVLKPFFQTDYRGLCAYLHDLPDLRRVRGLRGVPHFTTLHKASQRLLRLPRARRLLAATVRRHLRRRRRVRRAALDSTGLEDGHRSFYYIRRRNGSAKRWQTVAYGRSAKLEVAVDTASHLILAALPGRGPRVAVDRFAPLLAATLANVRVESVLADAGDDSEPNHRFARERHGVRSFIPAKSGRPTAKPPSGRYRRRMKQRLTKHYGRSGQRWQVETTFAMVKRRLTTAVAARRYWSKCRELLLVVLCYNLLLLPLG